MKTKIKTRKFPYNLHPKDFVRRAQMAPFGESWSRIGDVFFGVKYHVEDINASSSPVTITYFMTTSGIPASEAPTVSQEFWEKQLLYNLRRIENAKRST